MFIYLFRIQIYYYKAYCAADIAANIQKLFFVFIRF